MNFGLEYGSGGFGGYEAMGGYDGGFGGGGYVAEEKGKSSEKKNTRDRQTVRPITSVQFSQMTLNDDVYEIDGAEVSIVKVIGVLETLEEHATNVNFRVSDSTGIIECRQWVDRGQGNSRIGQLRLKSLIQVMGQVREYENKRHILVFDVCPVADWNELTHHLLDVVYTHLLLTRGPLQVSHGTSSHQHFSTPAKAGSGLSSRSGQSLNVPVQKETVNDSIYKVYATYSTGAAEGLNVNSALTILRKDGVNVSIDVLRRVVAQLCDDGRLYSTMDDDHHQII